MDLNNPRYRNQGIHVDMVLLTVEDFQIKALLIQRSRDPFVGEWILPGGAVYNNESVDFAAKRELKEKTGLENIYLEQFRAFGEPDRDPRLRMVSIAFLALIDKNKVSILQRTPKTLDARWWNIKHLPDLAFDHKNILFTGLGYLQKKIIDSNIVFELLPKKFIFSELQNVYEIILNKKLDRRNFRRKFLSLGLIEKVGEKLYGKKNRPADYYQFIKRKYMSANIF